MTIRLRVNPATGRHEVKVDLESDADALPFEHEELHRSVVSRLLEAGLLPPGESPEVVITRVGPAVETPAAGEGPASPSRPRAAEA